MFKFINESLDESNKFTISLCYCYMRANRVSTGDELGHIYKDEAAKLAPIIDGAGDMLVLYAVAFQEETKEVNGTSAKGNDLRYEAEILQIAVEAWIATGSEFEVKGDVLREEWKKKLVGIEEHFEEENRVNPVKLLQERRDSVANRMGFVSSLLNELNHSAMRVLTSKKRSLTKSVDDAAVDDEPAEKKSKRI
jgi:hypothetical protein